MLTVPTFLHPLIDDLVALTHQANVLVMRYYVAGTEGTTIPLNTTLKADNSPVTQADMAAHALISTGLKNITPHIPVISEEGTEYSIDTSQPYWLVDPLDGTKSFIRHTDEFTVNIALIVDATPVWGALGVPAQNIIYYVDGKGHACKKQQGQTSRIQVRTPAKKGMVAVASQSHNTPETDAFLKQHNIVDYHRVNSALKFAVVAEGQADIYPRFGTTMEWDTAAGHALILAAGGSMLTPEGEPFMYGKPEFRNGHFIARGAVAN